MIDVFLIPEGLENPIGEAEREDILNRLFAQVMIDTVDLVLAEDSTELTIELLGGNQITSKGLFNDQACPGSIPISMLV
jgi:hypothetical protein